MSHMRWAPHRLSVSRHDSRHLGTFGLSISRWCSHGCRWASLKPLHPPSLGLGHGGPCGDCEIIRQAGEPSPKSEITVVKFFEYRNLNHISQDLNSLAPGFPCRRVNGPQGVLMIEYVPRVQTMRCCTHTWTGSRQEGHSFIWAEHRLHTLWWPHGTARCDFGPTMQTMQVV